MHVSKKNLGGPNCLQSKAAASAGARKKPAEGRQFFIKLQIKVI